MQKIRRGLIATINSFNDSFHARDVHHFRRMYSATATTALITVQIVSIIESTIGTHLQREECYFLLEIRFIA